MSEGRSLGEAIRLRRLELSLSQEELGERIGPDVRQSDVSRLERGRILFPRLERLNQIADALELSLGALLIEAGWFSEEEASELDPQRSRLSRSSANILVADDEPVILDAIVSLLSDNGHGIVTAFDAGSLFETLGSMNPEIAIVDVALPGLELSALIQRVAGMVPPPTLVFMGTGMPPTEVEEPYLEKPIDSRQLAALVDSLEHVPPIGPRP